MLELQWQFNFFMGMRCCAGGHRDMGEVGSVRAVIDVIEIWFVGSPWPVCQESSEISLAMVCELAACGQLGIRICYWDLSHDDLCLQHLLKGSAAHGMEKAAYYRLYSCNSGDNQTLEQLISWD